MSAIDPGRRTFLKTGALAGAGALLLSFSSDAPTQAQAQAGARGLIHHFLRIHPDGRIVVVSPVAEIGQGTTTALAMIVADALDADWSHIGFELAGVAPEYRNPRFFVQLTGSSTGISSFQAPFREAGATARTMLVAAAAQAWSVAPEACVTERGRVTHPPSRRSRTYGELAISASALPVPKTLLPPAANRDPLVRTPVRRLDIPAKVNGSAKFTVDLRMPGMLYATVATAPTIGSALASDNRAAILAKKGVRGVVDVPNGVAIVADRWWIARRALDELGAVWAANPNDAVNDQTISAQLWGDLAAKDGVIVERSKDAGQAAPAPETTLVARYEVPFLAHATMEPMSCVARVDKAGCDVWVSSQLPDKARSVAAALLGLPEAAVTIHNMIGGGGFGRRQETDFVTQAVLAARRFPGRAVKLIWTREEDIQHDFYRPAGVSELTAGISGKAVMSFRHKQATPTILPRMYPSVMKEFDEVVTDGIFAFYDFPDQESRWVRSETHIPAGMWRSVGASQTSFAIESFVDEIAAKIGADPYQFRRERLQHDARALKVLDRLAEISGWTDHPGGKRAIGLSISHKRGDCLCGQAAEVSVEGGRVIVHTIWTVADPGSIINPDTARAQIEGAAIWGLSAALYGKISIKDGHVEQGNFDEYRVVRLADTPLMVTEIIQSGVPLEGIGEGGAPGIAPAIGNALFRLTGKRVRRLPIADQFA